MTRDSNAAAGGLQVRGLRVTFGGGRRFLGGPQNEVRAVRGVDLDVAPGETVGIVGESGSGKTTVARCIVGLQKPQAGTITFGDATLGPIRRRPPETQRAIQMVFQDPRSSLNPRMTAGAIVAEAWRAHPSIAPDGNQMDAIIRLLDEVGLDAGVADRRPTALSGGQCQRISIARALAARPRLLVCDEAVSALDVSVQAQILRLLTDLQRGRGLALLFVSHDLGVVRQIADRVVVMQEGEVVERGAVEDVFTTPHHDYTRTLLAAALDLEGASAE